jgi:endonuclease/exonuclease/phosphatase family metal-dependent hydrolase
LLNAVIDSFNHREIKLTGWWFAYANSPSQPTYEKLDRVLILTEGEFKYPLAIVQALDRGISDHTPLLLDTSAPSYTRIIK